MYGENFTQRDKTQAGWCWWSGFNRTTRRFKQRSLYQAIKQGGKIAVRRCYAIQLSKQRGAVSIISTYARKTRVDFCRPVSKSQGRIDGKEISRSNGARAFTEQSKLVWPNMVGARQYQRVRNYCKRMAPWCLSSLAKNNPIKKLSSPCGGLIDPSISPYYGLTTIAVSPCGGLIKGCFDTFLSPCGGLLLDIPLNIEFDGDLK